jgi:hypothetical protein
LAGNDDTSDTGCQTCRLRQGSWGDRFMYFAAVALVGASLGQPPAVAATPPKPVAQEYLYSKDRQIKLPIRYERDRKTIQKVLLYVARNGENTWYEKGSVLPAQDYFIFTAEDDGLYWFTIVDVDLQARRTPDDLTKTPPDLKVIFDQVKPRIQFIPAQCYRIGETIHVVWAVDDKNPDDHKTRVHFKPESSDKGWREVSLPSISKSGVEFSASTLEPVSVRVTAFDMAGNSSEATIQIGAGTNAQVSTNQSSFAPSTSAPMAPTAPSTPVVAPTLPGASPSTISSGPVAPVNPSPFAAIPPPDALLPPSMPNVPTVSSQTQGVLSAPTNPSTPYPTLPPLQPASNSSPQCQADQFLRLARLLVLLCLPVRSSRAAHHLFSYHHPR